MEKRKLTITLQADWKAALRAAGKLATHKLSGRNPQFPNPCGILFPPDRTPLGHRKRLATSRLNGGA